MHNFKTLYRKSLGGHACLQFRSYATRKTHYQVLGIKKTATQQEIKNAYIQLSKKHHPDTAGSGSKQTFTEINEAYSVLSKPLSRKEYDNQLAFSAAQNASSSYYRPHRGPQGSRPAGYPHDQYQQRQNERTYQSEESSTYSDFHRKRANSQQQPKDGPYKEYRSNYGGDPMVQLLKATLSYTYAVIAIVLILFYAMKKQVDYEKKQKGEPVKKGPDDGLDFMSRYTINTMSRSQSHNRDELRQRLKERYLELKENSKK